MVKITIGKGSDRSVQRFSANVPPDSTSEFRFGDLSDDARRDIDLFERGPDLVGYEVQQLTALLAVLPKTPATEPLHAEAEKVTSKATEMAKRRSWLSISADGIRSAAKFAGDVGTPVAGAALKLIELVEKLAVVPH